MSSRRDFLRSLTAASATVPALRNDAFRHLERVLPRAAGRTAADVAQDEDFWVTIQQAFDVDRSLVNLNNGGVAPSPRVVQDALRRYIEFSNNAPAITMWSVLEPEIEGVRNRLAALHQNAPTHKQWLSLAVARRRTTDVR